MANSKNFEVTRFHLALLQRLSIRWDDGAYDGSPAVDPKRPYGNSDVLADLREIFAKHMGYQLVQIDMHYSYDYSYQKADGTLIPAEGLDDELWNRHREMATVLQILVANASTGIREGCYTLADPYRSQWERAEVLSSRSDETELQFPGESGEVILEILMDRVSPESYYGKVSEASTGSETDCGASSPAELVEEALRWAGVEGFSARRESTIEELRGQLKDAANRAAGFELSVSIYTSF